MKKLNREEVKEVEKEEVKEEVKEKAASIMNINQRDKVLESVKSLSTVKKELILEDIRQYFDAAGELTEPRETVLKGMSLEVLEEYHDEYGLSYETIEKELNKEKELLWSKLSTFVVEGLDKQHKIGKEEAEKLLKNSSLFDLFEKYPDTVVSYTQEELVAKALGNYPKGDS